MSEKKKKNTKGLMITLVILIIIVLGCTAAYIAIQLSNGKPIFYIDGNKDEGSQGTMVVEKKTVQIYKGTDRPIAVMLDNNADAMPHGGINKAYLIYEIIVEGGETRLMALFKGQDVSKIGPVRSARHYFLDYALENDAIYVHFGWSPQAESDISTIGVNNINGIFESEDAFWRTSDKYAPHNVATETSEILKIAKEKGYRTTSEVSSSLNYVTDEVNLEDGKSCIGITIPFPSSKVEWTYNEDTKTYTRVSKGIKATDWETGEDYSAKNIIITYIENSTLYDGEGKDRQNMTTTGTKDGYYITNGKVIPIKCKKTTRSSKTEYTDLEGNEIKVNDGNTFIEIVSPRVNVTMEQKEEPDTEVQE